MTKEELAQMIDHTNLHADVREKDLKKLCEEAARYHFKMVAINSGQTARCSAFLKGTDVHVGAAVGFPLGQQSIAVKVYETEDAIRNGADEIDYVLNITELKEGNDAYIEEEMRQIVTLCRKHSVISKVIFENCYLTKEEIVRAAEIACIVRPDFIKTSTGFGTGGAAAEDVALMKSVVKDQVKVKAAGGIRTLEQAMKMIEAGAERIGTSAGIAILSQWK